MYTEYDDGTETDVSADATWAVDTGGTYASIDSNGLLTANSAGSATISGTTSEGSATADVTVTDTGGS